MNLGSCQMRSARSDIAASSLTPSPPRPRPRAPTPAWPRWPRRTRLWRRWRRCFGRLVVDSAATSSVHIRSPCCTTVSCLFRNFRQHFLKRGYFAILDFQPYYNIACILYTVELYTLHNYTARLRYLVHYTGLWLLLVHLISPLDLWVFIYLPSFTYPWLLSDSIHIEQQCVEIKVKNIFVRLRFFLVFWSTDTV